MSFIDKVTSNSEMYKNNCYMLFDLNCLLEVLTLLVSSYENKKLYLKYDDYLEELYPEKKIFRKIIGWNDQYGNFIHGFELGKYKTFGGNPNCILKNSVPRLYERITFFWLLPDAEILRKMIALDKQVCENKEQRPNESSLLISIYEFNEMPYIKEFIIYLVNYRIEHSLLDITFEQMQEVLTTFIQSMNQKNKILHQSTNIGTHDKKGGL